MTGRLAGTAAVLLVAAALDLGAAPAAQAAATLKGKTSQGRPARVFLDDAGAVVKIRINWRAGCGGSGRYRTYAAYAPPFRTQTADRIADGGSLRIRLRRGLRATETTKLRARRLSAFAWQGTLRARAVVRRRGRVIDRCRAGRISWRASIPQASITAAGEEGDYILGGQSVSFATPRDPVPVRGTSREVHASFGPYTLDIAAPPGARLTPGTFDTTRYPFNEGGGGLDVSGDGRGCNQSTGKVAVQSSSFGPKGRLDAIVVDFEQHCEGGAPALRGRLTFTR